MSFVSDNKAYESWLKGECNVVKKDIAHKHKRMKRDAFTFLRATFFRWAHRIESICPDLKETPAVLSVGDVHLENFGTWRDAEGRLIWGINDFDEAAVIPYAFDLLRLATSIQLAPNAQDAPKISMSNRAAAAAILEGYRRGIEYPKPTVLDEEETWMLPLVACTEEERQKFWNDIKRLRPGKMPRKERKTLKKCLPKGTSNLEFAPRQKGGGSLGRPRFVVRAEWRGGHVLREAKALVPSAWEWAHDVRNSKSRFLDLARGEFRAPDPLLHVRDSFIVRRIAPDSRKVELDRSPDVRLTPKLLDAMGFDLGAIHAATTSKNAAVRKDFDSRPPDWLYEAAKTAAAAVEKDFAAWTSYRPGRGR